MRSYATEAQNFSKSHARNMALAAIGLEGRKIMMTNCGLLGLVPEQTTVGDRIALLKGYTIPVVLRPFGDNFMYMGEAYIAGLARQDDMVII